MSCEWPVIRRASDRVRSIMGPFHASWHAVFGPVPNPPRGPFVQALALEVTDRAMLMQEIADALPQVGSSHGIIIIGGVVSPLLYYCGAHRIKHPFSPPPPP